MFKVKEKAEQETSRSRRQAGSTLPPASAVYFLLLLFDLEDGISPKYTELQPGTPHFSKRLLFLFEVYWRHLGSNAETFGY
jgi:hypothetical protein